MKLGVLTAFDDYHKYYVRACEELGVEYELIDIIASDWLKKVRSSDCAGFLCRPPSKFQERKSMFDEKLYLLTRYLEKEIYPSYDELFIYENKRFTSYWLDLHGFPHPETKVFYRKKEFLDYAENKNNYPFVVKSNIGSTAKGVTIIEQHKTAKKLANKYFGLINPKLARGHTSITTGRVIPFKSHGSAEKHFIICQQFEKIKWEWRIVKIDDSFFGHRKLLKGKFASGSFLKGWGRPPDELLVLVENMCNKGHFLSLAVDIFETEDGRFLVNEMQSLFGQKTKDLMLVDDKPGRIIKKDGKFLFEEGHFNQNQSYNLRVKHFLNILENKNRTV